MTDAASLLTPPPAAPAASQSTPPAPPAAQEPGQAPASSSAPAADWLTGADDSLRGVAEAKGWKSPVDAISAYVNVEKLVGAETLALPANEQDQAGWNALYDKLGRPAKAEDYQIPVPDGQDSALAQRMAPLFHQAGLNQKQVAALSEGWNAYQAEAQAAQVAAQAAESRRDVAALQSELGTTYDAQVRGAQHAVRTLGINADQIAAMETALGTGGTLKLFMGLAQKVGSDTFVSGDGGAASGAPGGFGLTPAAAGAEIKRLTADGEFQKRMTDKLHPEHEIALAKWNALHQAQLARRA